MKKVCGQVTMATGPGVRLPWLRGQCVLSLHNNMQKPTAVFSCWPMPVISSVNVSADYYYKVKILLLKDSFWLVSKFGYLAHCSQMFQRWFNEISIC